MHIPDRLLLPCLIPVLVGMAAACAPLHPPPGEDSSALLFWPDGDAHAGLQAFKDLKCTQCHKVETVPELADLTEEALGPALDSATARRERIDILVQIVAPGTDPAIQVSHMGYFDEVMTIRQLTDLIAFVESLHG